MCGQCDHKTGSTRHLLYWQWQWFKYFFTTWYHIVNRKAYWRWYEAKYNVKRIHPKISKGIMEASDHINMDEFTEEDWQEFEQEYIWNLNNATK